MFRFSAPQLLLLAFGGSLIVLSLVLDQIAWLWNRAPAATTLEWKHLRLVASEDQQFEPLDGQTLVVRSKLHPSARLTLFTHPDEGASPQQMVKNLCRRDGCTYTLLDAGADNPGAVATYREGETLRIVLMRPGTREYWLEFKGPPDAYQAFSNLIDAVSVQLRPAGAASPDR